MDLHDFILFASGLLLIYNSYTYVQFEILNILPFLILLVIGLIGTMLICILNYIVFIVQCTVHITGRIFLQLF